MGLFWPHSAIYFYGVSRVGPAASAHGCMRTRIAEGVAGVGHGFSSGSVLQSIFLSAVYVLLLAVSP